MPPKVAAQPIHVPTPSEKDDFLTGLEGMDGGKGREHLVTFLTAIRTWANEIGTTETQLYDSDAE